MANSPLQETFSWCSSRLTPVCRWISNQADLHLKTTNNSVRKALAIGQACLSVSYSTQTIPIHKLRTLSRNKGWRQATSNNQSKIIVSQIIVIRHVTSPALGLRAILHKQSHVTASNCKITMIYRTANYKLDSSVTPRSRIRIYVDESENFNLSQYEMNLQQENMSLCY